MPTLDEMFTDDQQQHIDEVVSLLGPGTSVDALEMACRLKRAEAFLKALREGLRTQANAVFEDLVKESPDDGSFTVSDVAVVSSYSPKRQFIYGDDIVTALAKSKSDMKTARDDGTATEVVPGLDSSVDTLFAISLNDKFKVV